MRRFLTFAIIATLFSTAFFIFGNYATNHFTGSIPQEQIIEVVPNEDARVLGARLEEKGIIFSRYTFWWELIHSGKARQIVAGKYAFKGSMTTPEIVIMLTSGETLSRDIKITFPEGWTAKKMSERLTANTLPGDKFLEFVNHPPLAWRQEFDFLASLPKDGTLEGYLFPDTYLFAPDTTAEIIVETMLKNFGKRVSGELRQAAEQKGGLYQALTLASIVEAEGKIEKDRAQISDVFWKRLEIGQPLQSDATVNYALGKSNLQSSLDDISVDSPYNTYKYRGLPPTPINNPGLESMRATIYPEKNPYYYFLTSLNTGETIFSVTFEEHIRNRQAHGL